MSDKYPLQTIAWELAEKYHQGQRYGKHPYIYHLSQVCEGTRRASTKRGYHGLGIDKACSVAILHDVLEDSSCTVGDLINAELPLEVCLAVTCLTKSKDVTYDHYIARILHNEMALMVKREDTMMNLTQSQHEGSIKRVNKYANQLARLYPNGH